MWSGTWKCLVIALCLASAGHAQPSGEAAELARGLMQTGLAQNRAGTPEDAIQSFTEAIETKALPRADLVRALYNRGVAYDSVGNTASAIADYSAAIRLDRKFAPALNNRANAHRRLGRLAEARRDYAAALKGRETAREYPYFGLGQIAESEGDIAAARAYYREAITVHPGFAPAASRLAAIANREGSTTNLHASASARGRSTGTSSPQTGAAQRGAAAQIQLGAFRSGSDASAAWQRISRGSGEILRGVLPRIVPVEVPGRGRFWRLRADVSRPQEARRLCRALVDQGTACIVVGGRR